MNWEAISAIAEILGALGVIASLLYLAVQIRGDRRSTRAQTRAALAAIDIEELRTMRDDASLMRLLAKVLNREKLDPVERLRFSAMARGQARTAENHFYQHRLGTLEDDEFEGQKTLWRGVFAHPDWRQWWEMNKGDFSVSFQRQFDELLVGNGDNDWWQRNLGDGKAGHSGR